MKNISYFLLLVMIVLTACQPNSNQAKFDAVTSKNELTKTLDKLYLAYNTKDIETFLSLMADDGLFCGTDPNNIWDKPTYSTLMTIMFSDPKFAPNIALDRREIRLENGGNSAMVVDQFFFEWNKKIPVRHIVHFVRTGDKWTCNFLSTTYVPNDVDMDKIFNALK